jgi:hypothetical protein
LLSVAVKVYVVVAVGLTLVVLVTAPLLQT